MPIQPAHLPPRHGTLAHPPPHGAHFPISLPAISQPPIPVGPLNRFPDIPPSAPQLLDTPPEALVRVLTLAQRRDGFVAELDDFEREGGGGEEDVVGEGGVEEGGLRDG